MNVHKTFRSCSGHLFNVLCTFSLRLVFGVRTVFRSEWNWSFIYVILLNKWSLFVMPQITFACIIEVCMLVNIWSYALHEKCPNTVLRSKSPYSLRIQENTDQKKTTYLGTFRAVMMQQMRPLIFLLRIKDYLKDLGTSLSEQVIVVAPKI